MLHTKDALHMQQVQEQLEGDARQMGLGWQKPWPQKQKMQSLHHDRVGLGLGKSKCNPLYTMLQNVERQEQDKNSPAIDGFATTAV
jgi:hypothetical protein